MQDLDIRGAGNLLGAEQSGFIADLGYETYVKILQQAVVEIRNEEPTPSPSRTGGETDYSQGNCSPGNMRKKHLNSPPVREGMGLWVVDCSLESDLEMYFPDQYVPSDSERMLLYRELDGLQTDEQLAAYRTRLIDRFGKVPHVGEELMLVVPLRRYGKSLGCEKVVLKQGRMSMFFVSNPNSPFYQSDTFDRILQFVATNPRRCNFREANGKRSMIISDIPTVEAAAKLLAQIFCIEKE